MPFLAALAACDGSPSALRHNIDVSVNRLGQQTIEDRDSYDSLNTVSFKAIQNYKIKSSGNSEDPQLLYMNVTQFAGDVVEQETSPAFVPLTNGEYKFECARYVSIKTSEEKNWGPIRCEFEPLAIFNPDARATLAKPSGKSSKETE
jgi:hypothetical protein